MRPQVCLRPSATITQSLTHKRTLINIGPKEKTLHSNISDIISVADYITRKIETEGLLPPQLLYSKVYLIYVLS